MESDVDIASGMSEITQKKVDTKSNLEQTKSEILITESSPKIKIDRSPPLDPVEINDFHTEGGWGWVVCVCAAVVCVLCGGVHLSYGSFIITVQHEFSNTTLPQAAWIGSIGICVNYILAPAITVLCRRKSPRIFAVIGGLVSALGFLFLSFATQLDQLYISIDLVLSIGCGMSYHTASIVVGRYFSKKRDIAELFIVTGNGFGIIIVSVMYKRLPQSLNWTYGFQCISGLMTLTIICGALYRPVSMFHPRRKVIVQMKNQPKTRSDYKPRKPAYFDFSSLRMRSVQILLLISLIISAGIYLPLIYFMNSARKVSDGYNHIELINVYLGLGYVVGSFCYSYIVIRNDNKCSISRRYLCQSSAFGCCLVSLVTLMAKDFNTFSLFACVYGICFGGFQYSFKSYTFDLVKSRLIEQTWSLLLLAQSLPVLIVIPTVAYLEGATSSKTPYIIASTFCILGSLLFFAMTRAEKHSSCVIGMGKHFQATSLLGSLNSSVHYDVSNSDQAHNASPKTPHSGNRHSHTQDRNVYQLQCIISKDKKKQAWLTKISENGENLPGVSNIPLLYDLTTDFVTTDRGRADCDSNNSLNIDQSHDFATSSSSSGNDRKSLTGNRNDKIVRVELVDPPSQERESTATVSYDSDLYISLCEAQV